MEYQVTGSEAFTIGFKEKRSEKGLMLLTVSAKAKKEAGKLTLRVDWTVPDVGVNVTWAPCRFREKSIIPDWAGYEESYAMHSAPVYVDAAFDDTNRQTIACMDGLNRVKIRTGVVEETGNLVCSVVILVDHPVSEYSTQIRIDTREIPFYKAVEEVSRWWEAKKEHAPAPVPEAATEPLYSAWYSYHQRIDVEAIVKECQAFGKLGCKVLIVDDGWQTDNNERGYAYCGDWQAHPAKVPDMKAFVDAVHGTGMKFMLWYSVPYVGEYSKAYERFKDKMLKLSGHADGKTWVLDPRYPEVRDYLIGLYCKAVKEWGLDGFKLDFIDSFTPSDVVKEGMDYTAVYDAVDRLMKDVIAALKKLKEDILIEFRQSYIGPLMRTYGNMFRVGDCPCDSLSNRLGALSLRMTSGSTAVHSDMVMWSGKESPEQAAFQLTNVLFAVPQISVKYDQITKKQAQMVKQYLKFWKTYKEVLLTGTMFYKGYASNFSYVSSRKGNTQVGAVYSGKIAYIEEMTEKIALVNASLEQEILIECKEEGASQEIYHCQIYDCCGKLTAEGETEITALTLIKYVPVNGTVILTRKAPIS